ncbi:hypothetical protein C8039_05425 [Halogeometricum sp. wsp3]|nr:hypothetical protein C8039_05425 [Halogeometricum sp. wsp3]
MVRIQSELRLQRAPVETSDAYELRTESPNPAVAARWCRGSTGLRPSLPSTQGAACESDEDSKHDGAVGMR